MNIDRAAFLALTATLAATGCAASSSDDAVSSDGAAISAGGNSLCYTAEEGTTSPAKDYWIGQIGFDAVNDFPSAEGFCFDMASDGKKDANGFPSFDGGVYGKCNAYAKVYVPQTIYTSYAYLKENLRQDMDISAKWDVLYALDQKIAAEDFFCVRGVDRAICSGSADQAACVRASTQMIPAAKQMLADCMQKFEAYSCIEGASQDLRPGGSPF